MNIFVYDRTFDGLLTAVFDAYFRRTFPDLLLGPEETVPLFYDELVEVVTDEEKSGRVWASLQKRLSRGALTCLTQSWLSELPEIGMIQFRYIRKTLDSPRSVEGNFGDPDVLELARIWKRVGRERHALVQFARFQKAGDGTYFAAFEPAANVLPLVIPHFKDRFADQEWLIYDMKRRYGYYYDLTEVTEVTLEGEASHLVTGMLDESMMDRDEKLFQQLWKTYFRSIAIRERINPRKQRQDMPVRYWKYLTEKQ